MTGKTHFIGIDPGNSAAKVVANLADGPDDIEMIVPNVSALAEELDSEPVSTDPAERIDVEILNPAPGYEGEYFIGQLAAKQLTDDVEQDRDRDKANSDNINLITPAVLAMFCHSGDKVVLGIGSPFADFQAQRPQIVERLQRRFQIRFGKYAGPRSGGVVLFEVIRVSPYPQTAGGYIAQALGPTGAAHPEWAQQNVVVFDLGLGQTGFAYMSAGEPQKPGCHSVDAPAAFLQVAKGVQDYLNSTYRRDLTIPETLDIIEAGEYRIRNEILDITNVVILETEQLVGRIKKRWEEKVPVRLRDQANAILLIGGGALAPDVDKIFSDEFGLPVTIGQNSRFSNARGFLEHARKKYQKEMMINAR